jgi:hypothetical protein
MGSTDSLSGATGVVSPDTFLLNISSSCECFRWVTMLLYSQIMCSISFSNASFSSDLTVRIDGWM